MGLKPMALKSLPACFYQPCDLIAVCGFLLVQEGWLAGFDRVPSGLAATCLRRWPEALRWGLSLVFTSQYLIFREVFASLYIYIFVKG